MANHQDLAICQRCQTDAVIAHLFYLLSRYAFEPTSDLASAIRLHFAELRQCDNVSVRLASAAAKLHYFWNNLCPLSSQESFAAMATPSSAFN